MPQEEPMINLKLHRKPNTIRDHIAFCFVRLLRFLADSFFAKRYGNRAIILETIAAVPGMVAGTLLHLRSLRRMKDDNGWIKTLLDEAENERQHLMVFMQIVKPTYFERFIVFVAQLIFYSLFFIAYIFSPKTCHRIVGYFEEEAVISYSQYLAEIDKGAVENIQAPQIAIDYWKLPQDARLREVIIAVRADEANHRDVNHRFADKL